MDSTQQSLSEPQTTDVPSNNNASGPNLVDSILQSIQSGTGGSVAGEPMPIPPNFDDLLPPPEHGSVPVMPLSDFSRTRQSILDEHIPRVERLAQNVIAGMYVQYTCF